MSIRTTKNEVMNNFNCYSIPYCALDSLLQYIEPIAHTQGIYGWNANIYVLNKYGNQAIVTGYRPFGNNVNSEIIEHYNNEGKNLHMASIDYTEKKNAAIELLNQMIADLLHKTISKNQNMLIV